MPTWLIWLLALWPVWAFLVVLFVARWIERNHDAAWADETPLPGKWGSR